MPPSDSFIPILKFSKSSRSRYSECGSCTHGPARRGKDPHSDYFGLEDAENFNIEMKLSLVGIGGTLQSKSGYCVVGDLVPGGPAARSGLLKPGDRIVAVAQGEGEPVNIMDMPPSQVVELIRGLKGSTVRLTIIPAGAGDSTRKTVSLVRDEIKLADEHAKAAIIDLPQTGGPALRLGVIDLPSFYGMAGERADGASSDITRLIKKLKQEGVRGLILDLRRNGGGSLEEAVRLTGLFIPSGPVVQTWMPEDDRGDWHVAGNQRALRRAIGGADQPVERLGLGNRGWRPARLRTRLDCG